MLNVHRFWFLLNICKKLDLYVYIFNIYIYIYITCPTCHDSEGHRVCVGHSNPCVLRVRWLSLIQILLCWMILILRWVERRRRRRKKKKKEVMSLLIQVWRRTIDRWDSSFFHLDLPLFVFTITIGLFGIFQWHFDIHVIHFGFDDLMRNMVLTPEYWHLDLWHSWVSWIIRVS